jgi:hypothetical protein
MRLDKHRAYSHVHGLPGVVFAQAGHYFDGHGHMVVDPESAGTAELPSPVPVATIDAAPTLKVGPDDMRLAVNKALKLQMENFGEEWKGIEHARKFLGVTE